MADLVYNHRGYAESYATDPNRIVVIDDNFASEGALLVQVEPRQQLRAKPPAAGELLYWNLIGFMSWEEMETFAKNYPSSKKQSTTSLSSSVSAGSARPTLETQQPESEPRESSEQEHNIQGRSSKNRRFRYYRTQLGMVIASLDGYDIPCTFKRPRQKSDGLDENGEMGQLQDVIVEELPWDYYIKQSISDVKYLGVHLIKSTVLILPV